MRKTGVGVIGTGFAATSHIDALLRIGVDVVAVAGSSAAKARAVAKRFGIERAFAGHDELIGHDSVEAVHNCTPNHLHTPINEAVLDAGKHVLSEKPLGMGGDETEGLVDKANAAGVVAGVCFNYRHYPLVREAKAIVEAETYGRPHLVHGSYLQDWLLRDTDWNWRLDSEKAGRSRAVADIGSHWIDLVQYVTGDVVEEVFGDLGTLHAARWRPEGGRHTFERRIEGAGTQVAVQTEDFASVLLRFADGPRGSFTVSQVSAGHKNRLAFEIDLSNASLAWDQEAPNKLWIGARDEANRVLPRDPGLLGEAASALAHFPGGHQEGWPDALKNLFLDFYAAIHARWRGEEHAPSFATFPEAHRVVRTVEAILQSHNSGAWVGVGSGEGRSSR